mgnify:FL=1
MGLMAVALILTVLSSVLPEGSVKKIAGVTGGLVLLMVILQGAERLDLDKLQLSYDDYSRQINEQIKAFQEKNGSIICAELLGAARPKHETAQPEARTAAYYQKRPCVGCVEDCAEIVEQYLCGTGEE